jgi:hypothetical protein
MKQRATDGKTGRQMSDEISPKSTESEVFTVASMKTAFSKVVVPCSLVEVYQHFRGTD